MRLLLDQNIYAVTARLLIDAGHDVILVAQLGLSQASDEEILTTAREQNRIMVTGDRDYGNLVFVKAIVSGVIYLRISPANINAIGSQLELILQTYPEVELAQSFVIVEPSRVATKFPKTYTSLIFRGIISNKKAIFGIKNLSSLRRI
ncbi:MAG: DUF5615 family PIN-like protein [Hormoscilla sp.]